MGITTSDAAATLPANAALVAGTRTFSVTLNTVGSRTVTATDITDGTKTANTSPAITVALGTAVKLGFTSQPGSSAINVPFTIQPVVAIQDAGGNTMTTARRDNGDAGAGREPGRRDAHVHGREHADDLPRGRDLQRLHDQQRRGRVHARCLGHGLHVGDVDGLHGRRNRQRRSR